MRDIQESEDSWMVAEDKAGLGPLALVIQGLVAATALVLLFCVLFVQTFKYGQRHPDPEQFVSYQIAIALANEREMFGRSQCESPQ